MEDKCIWAVGSTNLETGRSEMPDFCKKLKCDGIHPPKGCIAFKRAKPEPETIMQAGTPKGINTTCRK